MTFGGMGEKVSKYLTELPASQKLTHSLKASVESHLSPHLRDTFYLRAFSFLKIPVLFFVSPSVVELNDHRCVIRIPLNRRTKNHLNSMYFGVLAAGADAAGGLNAMRMIQREQSKVSLIFKDFEAHFLKRAEGDTLFTCEDGPAIQELVRKTIETGERQHMPVHVTATVPSKLGTEPVARFVLTLSLKKV
jgi:acyl-coenzyme A thioesterase PaaI-like protein